MQVITNPAQPDWKTVLQRPYVDNSTVLATVEKIVAAVKEGGDEVLKKLTNELDGVMLDDLTVSAAEIAAAEKQLSPELKDAILTALENIRTFHKAQLLPVKKVQTMDGVECWQKAVPIDKVGLYIPGGTAPLFSTVLMLCVPAQLARCKEVVLCTPCNKDGFVHPAILFAASQVGITKIIKVGGAQAIAAMAYGTETVPVVYKIFGPGNQYVTAAKQAVQMSGVAIDMPAGPSEVCVLADETAEPSFVAADLLSQAEHGRDSQVLLVTTSAGLVANVNAEIEKQVQLLPRKNIAVAALANSKAIIMQNMQEAIALVNEYAAEHLILSCKDADSIAEQITNAGSVFIGNYSPESVGDYASGTNHTLPTNAYARAYSGVSMDSFLKKITFQKLSEEGLQRIGETVIQLAEAEGLQAHAQAVKVRMDFLKS